MDTYHGTMTVEQKNEPHHYSYENGSTLNRRYTMDLTNTFFTVIVISVDMFESSIVDERHFGSIQEAMRFKNSLPDDLQGLVCEIAA